MTFKEALTLRHPPCTCGTLTVSVSLNFVPWVPHSLYPSPIAIPQLWPFGLSKLLPKRTGSVTPPLKNKNYNVGLYGRHWLVIHQTISFVLLGTEVDWFPSPLCSWRQPSVWVLAIGMWAEVNALLPVLAHKITFCTFLFLLPLTNKWRGLRGYRGGRSHEWEGAWVPEWLHGGEPCPQPHPHGTLTQARCIHLCLKPQVLDYSLVQAISLSWLAPYMTMD